MFGCPGRMGVRREERGVGAARGGTTRDGRDEGGGVRDIIKPITY